MQSINWSFLLVHKYKPTIQPTTGTLCGDKILLKLEVTFGCFGKCLLEVKKLICNDSQPLSRRNQWEIETNSWHFSQHLTHAGVCSKITVCHWRTRVGKGEAGSGVLIQQTARCHPTSWPTRHSSPPGLLPRTAVVQNCCREGFMVHGSMMSQSCPSLSETRERLHRLLVVCHHHSDDRHDHFDKPTLLALSIPKTLFYLCNELGYHLCVASWIPPLFKVVETRIICKERANMLKGCWKTVRVWQWQLRGSVCIVHGRWLAVHCKAGWQMVLFHWCFIILHVVYMVDFIGGLSFSMLSPC